jgi:septal ring factor EnvC (AmiA/AmiB activator)
MRKHFILFLASVSGVTPAVAQWAVFDVPNLTQSIANYAALTTQIAKQATQISHQVEQIRQFETQLNRLGDMSSYRSLVGFSEFRADLGLPTQVRTWADRLSRVDGRGLFGDSRGGIFPQVTVQFPDFDGAPIARDPQVFKQSHDVVTTVDEFKAVQSDVYVRREDLKRAIARTSEAMQAATTEAEQQKLQAVIDAQYGQLSAVDAEVALSAAEVQVKAAEAAAMNSAHGEAEAEARRSLAQQEVRKISTAFTPTYDCLLMYVTERRLGP